MNSLIAPAMPGVRMTQARRIVLRLMLVVLAALVAYVGVLSYLSPELLLEFSSAFTC